MQRLLVTVFFSAVLFSAPIAFASKVYTLENKTFRPNQGIVEIPSVIISDEPDMPGSLSGANSFALILSTEANVRFAKSSSLSASVSGADIRSSEVSDDLRSIRFLVATPVKSGASLVVSGMKVVVYNRYSPLRGFDLDVGSDGTVDAYDPNGVRVTDEYAYPDTTPPHEPVAVTGAFMTGSVIISASPSGDLDFEQFSISFETASGTSLANYFSNGLSARAFELPFAATAVRVKSVDNRGNTSSGVVVAKSHSEIEIPASSGSTSTGGSTDSGASASSGSVSTSTGGTSTGSTTGTSSSGALAPLYVPTYQRIAVTNVIAAMDRFVLAHVKQDAALETVAVRMIRNDLAKLFESFYRTRIVAKKRLLVGQIRTKVAALKSELLK